VPGRSSRVRPRWLHGLGQADARALLAVVLLVLVVLPVPAGALDATDPRRSQLWWFDQIGVERAWDTSQGGGVVVAVLDTGADLDHPDLMGQFATAEDGRIGHDLVERDSEPRDPNGHGTIVAGLAAAAANNGEGVAGVAPLARIMPVRVLDANGRGDASTVDAGIRWAVDNGADVINLSLEVEETEDGPDATLTAPNAAIEYAWENGVVVVAATGNSGGGAAGYPEGSPVLLVGATDKQDELATFSDADRLDAVMAPGVQMVSTWCQPTSNGECNPDARYGQGDGTSFAAPVASGVVALLLGAGLDHRQAVRVLRETAIDLGDEGPDERFGVGRIDAAAAVAAGAGLLASGEEPTAVATDEPTATPPEDQATTSGDETVAPLSSRSTSRMRRTTVREFGGLRGFGGCGGSMGRQWRRWTVRRQGRPRAARASVTVAAPAASSNSHATGNDPPVPAGSRGGPAATLSLIHI